MKKNSIFFSRLCLRSADFLRREHLIGQHSSGFYFLIPEVIISITLAYSFYSYGSLRQDLNKNSCLFPTFMKSFVAGGNNSEVDSKISTKRDVFALHEQYSKKYIFIVLYFGFC